MQSFASQTRLSVHVREQIKRVIGHSIQSDILSNTVHAYIADPTQSKMYSESAEIYGAAFFFLHNSIFDGLNVFLSRFVLSEQCFRNQITLTRSNLINSVKELSHKWCNLLHRVVWSVFSALRFTSATVLPPSPAFRTQCLSCEWWVLKTQTNITRSTNKRTR